jgi:uncharacterized phiE125 gp8 family phage protein
MNYNDIISIEDVTDESGVFEEPVSLDEMKDYLRLEGYTDNDESTSDDLSDFDFDDRLITDLIRAGREKFEGLTNTVLLPKTLEVVFTNLCGMIELPGPFTELITLVDEDDTEILAANYKLIGNKWKLLKSPCYKNMTATLTAGYTELPYGLKIDIMRLVAYMYENRGEDASINRFASQLAGRYARGGWIV